jgi:hypothetical protein
VVDLFVREVFGVVCVSGGWKVGVSIQANFVMFSDAFSPAFAGVVGGYIGPVMAQAALVAGAAWEMDGGAVLIDGRRLIGPAGKVYAFSSPESAARWIEAQQYIGGKERDLLDNINPAAAALWKERKRAKLVVIAGRVIEAAARTADAGKRAALVAESDFLLSKWG